MWLNLEKQYSFFESVAYLFSPQTLQEQGDYALRSLLTFGAVSGLIISALAAPIIDFIAEKTGTPKLAAEAAKGIVATVATVTPIP